MSHLLDLAIFNKVHEALRILVEAKLLPESEVIRFMRKYMDDHPEFKKAVQESFNRTVMAARTEVTKK